MKNKVLISLIVPSLMEEYEIFIPVNERISKIKELIMNTVYDLTDGEFDKNIPYSLINAETEEVYTNDMVILNTNIRNNTKLVLFPKI